MTSRDFCYWLQGYLEVAGEQAKLTDSQMECVRKHLALVFKHEIDPSFGPPAKQALLDAIHKPQSTGVSKIDEDTPIRC